MIDPQLDRTVASTSVDLCGGSSDERKAAEHATGGLRGIESRDQTAAAFHEDVEAIPDKLTSLMTESRPS
jgi:hypothetical protein